MKTNKPTDAVLRFFSSLRSKQKSPLPFFFPDFPGSRVLVFSVNCVEFGVLVKKLAAAMPKSTAGGDTAASAGPLKREMKRVLSEILRGRGEGHDSGAGDGGVVAMPKSTTGGDTAASAGSLRRELKRVLSAILRGGGEGDDSGAGDGGVVEAIDEAVRILGCLRKCELKAESEGSCSPASSYSSSFDVPKEFICPLSMKIMSDPVIVATGQTYERVYIQKWLDECERTCPSSKEVLSHTVLTPNHLVRDLITKWCRDNRVELPEPAADADEAVRGSDRDLLESLLEKISSSSVSDQKEAAKELRRLTKRLPSFRLFFLRERPDSISQLLSPLSSSDSPMNSNHELQEDLITTVFNLSIPEKNKTLIVENPVVIPLLARSLAHGTMETRRNAAATFFSLSTTDSNKRTIGNSEAIVLLMDLIEEGDTLAMKDAGAAIFNLCTVLENKEKAVQAGAVPVLTRKIKDGVFVDASLSILALLSPHRQAAEEMVRLGLMSDLFSIIRKPSCPRMNENAVVIVFSICDKDISELKAVLEEENQNRTLTNLAMQGTDRAKRKANSLLQKLKRKAAAYDPHTA